MFKLNNVNFLNFKLIYLSLQVVDVLWHKALGRQGKTRTSQRGEEVKVGGQTVKGFLTLHSLNSHRW